MKTLVIGDIHGCYEELKELFGVAGIGPDDRVVAVGDVVNRGPETPQVLDLMMRRRNTLCVMGNHEWKHVQGHASDSILITRWQCGVEKYREALAWMRRLPYYLDLDEALVVHWGVEPDLALEHQDPAVLLGLPAGERRLAALHGDANWYQAYHGPRRIIYGHHDWAAGVHGDSAYGVDTGCVYGRKLTGLLLPEFALVSVPARENHWANLQVDWADRLAEDRRPDQT